MLNKENTVMSGPALSPDLVDAPSAPALELIGVTKTFPGVRALSDVTLRCYPGEVHALVGENGSGKSTLVKIASGSLDADVGVVRIAGTEVNRPTPLRCRELGLVTAYQDTALVLDLTVAQNIMISLLGRRSMPVWTGTALAEEILDKYQVPFSAHDRVVDLSPGSRQILEAMRALAFDPKILLLDEPTATMDAEAVEYLSGLLRTATASGTAVLYITHRLDEVRQLASRLTVIRDGEIRSSVEGNRWSAAEIVDQMVGMPTDLAFPPKPDIDRTTTPTLRVEGLSGRGFHDVSIHVRPGEIVGIAGAEGNGQREFVRAVAGLESSRGSVSVGAKNIRRGSVDAAVRAGLAFQSGDRDNEAAFDQLSVTDNSTLHLAGELGRFGFTSPGRARKMFADVSSKLSIKSASPFQKIGELSGGNQQKVVLGRAVLRPPSVLVIDEPTQGVDARARLDIYRELRSQADAGASLILCSSDAFELAGMCDRVYAFSRGQVVQELTGSDFEEADVIDSFVNVESSHAAAGPEAKVSPLNRIGSALINNAAILLLCLLTIGVAAYGISRSSAFLTSTNMSSLLTLALPILVVAIAQQIALMLGVFDISIGANLSLSVVIASFFATSQSLAGSVPGMALCLLAGLLIGCVNAFLVQGLRINAIIATIGTMGIVQGLAVILRPEPGGLVGFGLTEFFSRQYGFVPVVFVYIAVAVVVLHLALTRTTLGLRARATGLAAENSRRMGIRVERNRVLAFVVCGGLAGIAGIIVASQVGVGSNSVGTSYALTSVTVCFLAGASLSGGKGNFLVVLLGALFVALLINVAALVNVRTETVLMVTGGLTILAVAFQTQGERLRRRAETR